MNGNRNPEWYFKNSVLPTLWKQFQCDKPIKLHKEMVAPICCGRTWLACADLWPQPYPPLRVNWNVDHHQCWTSPVLLWLNGSKPPQPYSKIWWEAWNQMSGGCSAASMLLHKCLLDGWVAPETPSPPTFPFDDFCNFLKQTIRRAHPPHGGVKVAKVWTSLFSSFFTLDTTISVIVHVNDPVEH